MQSQFIMLFVCSSVCFTRSLSICLSVSVHPSLSACLFVCPFLCPFLSVSRPSLSLSWSVPRSTCVFVQQCFEINQFSKKPLFLFIINSTFIHLQPEKRLSQEHESQATATYNQITSSQHTNTRINSMQEMNY